MDMSVCSRSPPLTLLPPQIKLQPVGDRMMPSDGAPDIKNITNQCLFPVQQKVTHSLTHIENINGFTVGSLSQSAALDQMY